MMSPKHNDTSAADQINNKLNKVTKASSSSPKRGATQKLLIGKTLKEKPINLTQQKQVTNAQAAMRYNSNKLMVKPIIKNNDSNTSIKASNKTCNLIGEMINDVSKSTIDLRLQP